MLAMSQAHFFTAHVGELLNLFACFAVLCASAYYLLKLRESCRHGKGPAERATEQIEPPAGSPGAPQVKAADTGQLRLPPDHPGWSALAWSFSCWIGAWGVWLVLYMVRLLLDWFQVDAMVWSPFVQIVSDVNSVCLFLGCYGLTRAGSVQIHFLRWVGVIVLVAVVLFDLVLYFVGWHMSDAQEGDIFLRLWSGGLAIFTPMLFGRVFTYRFKTNSVFLLSIAYGALQPFAYSAAFSMPADRAATVQTCSQVAWPPEVSAFVTQVPVTPPATPPVYEYRIMRQTAGRAMSGRDLWTVLCTVWPHVEAVTCIRVYLRLRLESIVFVALAIAKLFWGAEVLAKYRVRPDNLESVINYSPRPSSGVDLVEHWQWCYWPLVAIGLAILGLIPFFFGVDTGIIVNFLAGVVAAVMYWGKGGRPLLAWISKQGE